MRLFLLAFFLYCLNWGSPQSSAYFGCAGNIKDAVAVILGISNRKLVAPLCHSRPPLLAHPLHRLGRTERRIITNNVTVAVALPVTLVVALPVLVVLDILNML